MNGTAANLAGVLSTPAVAPTAATVADTALPFVLMELVPQETRDAAASPGQTAEPLADDGRPVPTDPFAALSVLGMTLPVAAEAPTRVIKTEVPTPAVADSTAAPKDALHQAQTPADPLHATPVPERPETAMAPAKPLDAVPATLSDLARLTDAAEAAATPAVTPAAPTSLAQAPATERDAPLRAEHRDWGRALGERVIVSLRQGQTQAELQLAPPELGRVEIRIRIEGDQASLWFAAAQPEARAALDLALPALRERLAEDGLNLAHAQVSQGFQNRSFTPPAVERAPDALPDATDAPMRLRLGLIDDYA